MSDTTVDNLSLVQVPPVTTIAGVTCNAIIRDQSGNWRGVTRASGGLDPRPRLGTNLSWRLSGEDLSLTAFISPLLLIASTMPTLTSLSMNGNLQLENSSGVVVLISLAGRRTSVAHR